MSVFLFLIFGKFLMVDSKMDPNHVPPLSEAIYGEMFIREESIGFLVEFKKTCPENRVCSDELPEPIDINLPVVEQIRGRCLFTIIAEKDEIPRDGILQRLIVRIPTCSSLTHPEIEVTYTTQGYLVRETLYKYDSYFSFRPVSSDEVQEEYRFGGPGAQHETLEGYYSFHRFVSDLEMNQLKLESVPLKKSGEQ